MCGKYRVRRAYQLSKIGKEERKSGLFRFCRPFERALAAWRGAGMAASVAILRWLTLARRRPRAVFAAVKPSRRVNPLLAPVIAAGAIKKLPQAGQEPVEAVESGHSNPDAAHANR
jgi:hypothetical protein